MHTAQMRICYLSLCLPAWFLDTPSLADRSQAEQPICHNFGTIYDLGRVDWLYSMLVAALAVQDTARH